VIPSLFSLWSFHFRRASRYRRKGKRCRKNTVAASPMAKGAGPIKSQNSGWSVLAAAIVLESRSVRVKLNALMSLVGRSICWLWRTWVNRRFALRVSICKPGRVLVVYSTCLPIFVFSITRRTEPRDQDNLGIDNWPAREKRALR
jgi:hypothetical protein